MRSLAIVLIVAACGGGNSNTGDASTGGKMDARVFQDAAPSVPAMITIGGTALASNQSGAAPLAAATIKLLKMSDDSMLATATSDAQGKYTMTVTTNGQPVDAYITANATGYQPAASFPAGPFLADVATADSNMVKTGDYGGLIIAGQQAGHGFVVVTVLDHNDMPVQGATISSTPASTYKYSSNGIPVGNTATDTDGAGFFVNVPPGTITINAAKSGMTFKSHTVKAAADVFTSSVILAE